MIAMVIMMMMTMSMMTMTIMITVTVTLVDFFPGRGDRMRRVRHLHRGLQNLGRGQDTPLPVSTRGSLCL